MQPESDIPTRPPRARPGAVAIHAGASEISVYVHFPWCLKKCPYCDFLSVAAPRQDIDHHGYAEAVCRELDRRAAPLKARRLSSVFIGGGTPSLWDAYALEKVLHHVAEAFGNAPREVTVECNPTSFDSEVAAKLHAVGVGRVSIGVQGLSASRLEFLGRLHGPGQALEAVRAAIRSPIPRVSADLIYGLHGQTPREAAREVGEVAELGVTHLSAYTLAIEPGTQFGALARRGRLPLLPDDDVADSYVAVHEELSRRGFDHYEVSNFAREGHVAEHNLAYWRGLDYLGVGCGAWGTVPANDGAQRVRYRNTLSPERYVAIDWGAADLDVEGGASAQAAREIVDGDTRVREMLMLGLRLREGVDTREVEERTGATVMTADRRETLDRLVRDGRVVVEGTRVRIPHEHWLVADGIAVELM